MKEELVELINKKKTEIEERRFNKEDETKQGLILPILNGLGWDIFNTNEVNPEYGIDRKEVDYCLKINNKPSVFVEVKKTTENIETHQKQLLGYSFSQGIELSILTNGVKWWFYLPMTPNKIFEERIFCKIEITQDKISDIVDNFIKFLSKERIKTNESLKLAKETYENKLKKQTVEETIPRVWNGIITELLENQEKSLLYDLILDETYKLCNISPQPQSIINFIQSYWDSFFIDEENKPISIEKPKDTSKTSTSPKKIPTTSPSNKTTSSKENYYGKKVKSFSFDGKRQEVKLWKDVLVRLCEMLYERHSQDFSKVFDIKGRKRQYFVKNPTELSESRPISDSGIYVLSPSSSNSIIKRCEEVLTLFGYSIKELELEFHQSQTTEVESVKNYSIGDTSSSVIKKIEKKFQKELVESDIKRGRKKYYTTKDNTNSFLILTSKQYENGKKGFGFWYGLRQNQIKFLSPNESSYLVLVCGSSKLIFLQKWDDFQSKIKLLHTSGEGDKKYYHIRISNRKSKFLLQLPDLSNIEDITDFFI